MAVSMGASKSHTEYDQQLLSFIKGQALELTNVVHTKTSLEFKPKTKFNIGYIVAAVIFNEKNEVLLIQEAKRSCLGLWYLPAGRVEPGENLIEGVQREVEEEAGLQFKPNTMVTVESQGASWYRFTFTGQITGGELKTEAEADSESLQAGWFPFDLVANPQMGKLHLRAHDIIPLVQKTQLYRSSQQKPHPSLPLLVHHDSLIFRLLIICPCGEGKRQHWYLRRAAKTLSLLSTIINPFGLSLEAAAKQLIEAELQMRIPGKICGVLNLEYQPVEGRPDGICLNLVYSVEAKGQGPPKVKSSSYRWEEATHAELAALLKERLCETGNVALLAKNRKEKLPYSMSDKITLATQVLAVRPFGDHDTASNWAEVAGNVTAASLSPGFNLTFHSARDHFYKLLRYHHTEESERFTKSGAEEKDNQLERLLSEADRSLQQVMSKETTDQGEIKQSTENEPMVSTGNKRRLGSPISEECISRPVGKRKNYASVTVGLDSLTVVVAFPITKR